jgi:O-antigen/teichoic acid export membrane protein
MSYKTIIKNAFANVCRGGASALLVLLLPPFLTKILSKDSYGIWLLILQLSSYVSFLEFGVQTAVGRYVAYHNQLEEPKKRDSIVSTAIIILAVSAVFATIGILFLVWQLPNIFKDIPLILQNDAQLALLCVGLSLALGLPFSVFGGIFIGLQRYDIPAWIIASSKLSGGVFVVLTAHATHSIVMMAVVISISNIASGIWQFLAYKKVSSGIKISHHNVSINSANEIVSYCFGLSVWTVGMILVSGIDTTIIGYFDYHSLVYYSLAASLTSFVTSLQASLITVIMPKAAETGAKKDSKALGDLLVLATRYSTIIMVLISLPLLIAAKPLLTIWVGSEYASHTTVLLQVLIVANFIRYLGSPYATIAVAVGEQKKIILSPLVEGIANFCASMALTIHYGAIGVAFGTLFGSFISVGMHFVYNLPRTDSIKVTNKKMLLSSVSFPLLTSIPALFIGGILNSIDILKEVYILGLVLSCSISFFLLWKYVISQAEKDILTDTVNSRIKALLKM